MNYLRDALREVGLEQILLLLETELWTYLCLPLLLLLGLILLMRSRAMQIFQLGRMWRTFFSFLSEKPVEGHGTHPLKVFFASIGGCIGIGNLVVIVTAVKIGGPGTLFWVWVGGFLGMAVKYSEVFLGMRYRVANDSGGYDGGPMYFVLNAFKGRKAKVMATVVALLICFYGTEVLMFRVVVDSVSHNWFIPRSVVVVALLAFTTLACLGGIERIGKICSTLIPIFLVCFISMACWALLQQYRELPAVLYEVFSGAFSCHTTAAGAFAGSSLLLTIKEGIERGSYSGDIGIGYAAIVHAESSETNPAKQASLAVIGIILDTFIVCSISIGLVLLTGTWKEPLSDEVMLQHALGHFFPNMNIFMPLFLLLLGVSNIITFFFVGLKSASYLSPKYGAPLYYAYALSVFLIFSLPSIDMIYALATMQFVGGLLVLANVSAIFRLRKEISFTL